MTKRKILPIILTLSLLTGCADVPESLRQETAASTQPAVITVPVTDSSGETVGTETVDFQPVEHGDLDAIRAQLDYDLQKSYANITVKWARVGNGDTMPTYDVKTGRGKDFDIYAHAEFLLGDHIDVRDEKYWTHKHIGDPLYEGYPVAKEPTLQPDGKILNQNYMTYEIDSLKEDYKRDIWLGFVSNTKGEIWGSRTGCKAPEGTYYHDDIEFKVVARYDLDYEDLPEGLSYTMYGGEEWSVSDAIEYVENFFNTEIAPSDPQPYTYSAKTLFIKTLPGDTFGYLFVMQKQDEAGNYLDVDRQYIRDMKAIENGEPFMIESGILCWCSQKETPTRYTKDYSVSYEAETNSGNDLLTLGAATDILSEKLASNIGLDLIAELNYVTVCKCYPYYSIWEYPEYYEDLALTDCELELKPYWCFRRVGTSTYVGDQTEIYFVDAVTGEVVTMFYGEVQRR